MKYQLQFGSIPASAAAKPSSDGRFRLAILADLSGRASRGERKVGKDLAASPGRRMDVDNIEDRLEQADLTLQLDIGPNGTVVEVPIRSLDDFHPDELYDNLDFFSEFSGWRRQLNSSSTFDNAARQVMEWASEEGVQPLPKRSGSSTVPRGKLSDFADLMSRTESVDREEASADALIRGIVAPFVVPGADPRQEELVAAVDEALADAMRRVLHHPDFQAAESTWRTLDLIVRRLETGSTLEIVVFDISAEELAADLSAHEDLSDSGLYQLLVEQPKLDAAQGPFSAIVGNYLFEQTPPHADLLARCAQIAAAAGCPFLTGMSISSLEKQLSEKYEISDSAWESLRAMPESVYLGLVSPRFLLRWPYGKKTEPIDPFEFEEFTRKTGLRGMLWGNGAMLGGMLLAQTFLQGESLQGMSLGDVLTVDDLPYYYYTDKHGDQVALPCGERLMPEQEAQALQGLGCIPVLSMKNSPEVRLAGFRGVNGASLAGPWAPVAIAAPTSAPAAQAPAAPEPPPAATPEPAPAAVEPPPPAESAASEAPAAQAPPETAPEPAPAPPEPAPAEEAASVDDELDALLASLDADDDTSSDDEEDMDPELAKLLEGL